MALIFSPFYRKLPHFLKDQVNIHFRQFSWKRQAIKNVKILPYNVQNTPEIMVPPKPTWW